MGVDTTGSTPLPVDENGKSLAYDERFTDNIAALAWLWKDHTGVAEAEEITKLSAKIRPEYIAKCGGIYSSEWFFSKILRCLKTSPEVFDAAFTWYEIADWIPATLCGVEHPKDITLGICAAGHKAMYSDEWNGFPDAEFLGELDPKLATLHLVKNVAAVDKTIGYLTADWAKKLGLSAGIPVAVGAFDAHLGAIGAGICEGTLVKIIGTSACDIAISSNTKKLADIPGLCGIVNGSVFDGFYGLEAGQSAVGDIFNWYVNHLKPTGEDHISLSEKAAKLKAGESGLLALDWNNGNRTILVDQRLSGLLIGQTLYTNPHEIYRALVEATAFGALTIINRFEEYGVVLNDVINCGGIAEKSDFVMQIYADVIGKPMKISRSAQTCALGAAIAGAVVAGSKVGGYDNFADAQNAMTGLKEKIFLPNASEQAVYSELYAIYKKLHDAFGVAGTSADLSDVMKNLLEIRNRVRKT
jgi:L-ribulokinase